MFLSKKILQAMIFAALALACLNALAQSEGDSASSTDTSVRTPKANEIKSAFHTQYAWNHFALELGGGYIDVASKGNGFFQHGFNVTGGVVDHLSSKVNIMVETQFMGLEGNSTYSNTSGSVQPLNATNTDFDLDFAASYALFGRSKNSPYLLGGVGYYYIGPISQGNILVACTNSVYCPGNIVNSASSTGFQSGVGFRHRLSSDRNMELYCEGRYHYLMSSHTAFGLLTLVPISAGIRW